jgi:hypothetical protein
MPALVEVRKELLLAEACKGRIFPTKVKCYQMVYQVRIVGKGSPGFSAVLQLRNFRTQNVLMKPVSFI